jgi:hypothetical protein
VYAHLLDEGVGEALALPCAEGGIPAESPRAIVRRPA